jgi:branched-chain amino acid aminotransferase
LFDFDSVASIYEVIRIFDGIPLFVEKHLERFNHSAMLAGLSNRFNINQITGNIIELAKKNQINNGNVKLVFTFNQQTEPTQNELFIYFIPHHYPDDSDYKLGVKLITLIAERPNPNAKIHHADLRNQANELISHEVVYEVLLVNNEGFITEGSRSNVFFVDNKKVVTPPIEKVLPGITRELVIKICETQHIDFEEQMIDLSTLKKFQAAFITGTSPKVLPISTIDNLSYNPQNEIVQRIFQYYDKMIIDYLRNFNNF